MGTLANCAVKISIYSSHLADIPANFEGSGPIIFTNAGTSRWAMVQNLFIAFKHRNTCSSEGFPWKNCKTAIANSLQTSSKTWKIRHKNGYWLSEVYYSWKNNLTRGKSLLEPWGNTFLPDWQPPLMFVWFTSKSDEQ